MKVEGWFRDLTGGRTEIFLKGGGLKFRCSGTEADMNAVADLFEERTGLSVNGPDSAVFTRRRSGPKPIQGQMNLMEMTGSVPDDEPFGVVVPNEKLEFTDDMDARR